MRRGRQSTPTVPLDARRRRKSRWGSLGGSAAPRRRRSRTSRCLRRLSEPELAPSRRPTSSTRGGTSAQQRGEEPRLAEGVDRAALGRNGEMVVTVAWEISWYQYRVSPDAHQPLRLAERGHDLGDLEQSFQSWNAQLADDSRLMPDIAGARGDSRPCSVRGGSRWGSGARPCRALHRRAERRPGRRAGLVSALGVARQVRARAAAAVGSPRSSCRRRRRSAW